MAKPVEKFIIRHPESQPGVEDPYYIFLTFDRPLAKLKEQGKGLMMDLMKIDGLEGADRAGRYTLGIGIARTFDPAEVKQEIEAAIAAENSGIIVPDRNIVC